MNDPAQHLQKPGILIQPTYGAVGPAPRTPSLRQVIVEWVDAISFWRDPTRLLPAAFALYHFITFLVFIYYLVWHSTLMGCLTVFLLACFIGTVYNTVWYHRYCSHQAFKFSSLWIARLFLWTNPICYREECYVIPHRVHHSKTDEPGDPYGPHLGWLGSYLASETQQKTNRHISEQEYERLRRSLGHCGFLSNSYQAFQKTGSVERVGHYLARVVTANLLWNGLAWVIAGWQGVLVWVSAVFLFTFVLRDFNYRGHSSFVGTGKHGEPVNQTFYGLIAGEWHKNHHDHPRLARSGLRWWQVDVPYWIILLMKSCGLVTKYHSMLPRSATQPSES